MKILDLVQGSDEWLEARLNYLCASEAPAMMGESPYMSRNQLLALKKGWQSNPVSSFKQKLFDKGHENEDKARELLEMEIIDTLKPVVGLQTVYDMELLASFDGFNFGSYLFEHKDWNLVLAENVRNGVLEPLYYWQLEHQMLVADLDEVNFMVSDGTLNNREMMVYKSDPERRDALISGWKQFLIDLAEYQLEAKAETIIARVQDDLPVIECRVDGGLVISNLGDYIPVIKNLAEEQKALVLETDQDFIDKDEFNKKVKKARENLKAKASDIEKEFISLAEFNENVKEADSILQKLQSHGERQVKESKETKKNAIVIGASNTINAYLQDVAKSINGVLVPLEVPNWGDVIKGKRSFEKMQDAVDEEIARLKIIISERSLVIRNNLDSFTELASEHKFLFNDYQQLILKENEDLVNLIKTRISDHELAEQERKEREREQMRIEEEEKARKKAEAEEKARLEAEKEKEAPKPEPVKNSNPEPKESEPSIPKIEDKPDNKQLILGMVSDIAKTLLSKREFCYVIESGELSLDEIATTFKSSLKENF